MKPCKRRSRKTETSGVNIINSPKIKKLEKSLKRQQKSLLKKFENKKRKGGETANNIQKNILKVQRYIED